MTADPDGVLLLCYGNPGRLDDGLGAAFAEALEGLIPPGVEVEVDYQLTVEHAATAASHRYVVFVDAAVDGREPYSFRRLHPGREATFSTHSVEPEAVLAMAGELFGHEPEGYALGIRGYSFDAFGEELSVGARRNLTAALRFVLPLLQTRTFGAVAATLEPAAGAANGERTCETEST
ncbi:MAG: hydrogenase maturation protease [Candidatus Latescibacterota bacterium]